MRIITLILSVLFSISILISEEPETDQKNYPDHVSKQRQAAIYFSTAMKKHKEFDFKGAVEYYSKILDLYPYNSMIFVYRGNAKSAMKDYQGAVNDYSKAIELSSESHGAYYERGRTYISIGNLEEGCKDLSKAEEMGNTNSQRFIRQFCN